MTFFFSLFDPSFKVFLGLAFLAAALLLGAAYQGWQGTWSPEARRIDSRLRDLAPAEAGGATASFLRARDEAALLERLRGVWPGLRALERLLEQSGLPLRLGGLLALILLAGLGGLALGLVLALNALWTAALAAAGASLPLWHVLHRRQQRLRRLERQLPDALDLIRRALRAGHAFGPGLSMVAEEMPEPIGGEFRRVHEETSYGVPLAQALHNLGARVPSTDLRYFIIAVLIQRESGGNLSEILGNLATLVRERFKLLEKVRVLAAEGRLSAWILGLLPFVVAGVIQLVNPGFLAVLWTDPLGLRLVDGAAVMLLLGVFWMRRIIRIHV